MNNKLVRVRFAPSPTGLMHLGGVRTALFNYLFAKKYAGTFILRIEDTDQERNFDPGGKQIIADLAWLKLTHNEGPDVGGPFSPYKQSERTALYQERLDFLKNEQKIYRCFCSVEELEKKRLRQIALKQPPRYDRTCLALSAADIEQKLKENKPFIWRCKMPDNQIVHFQDIARGTVTFDLQHFSDFPLTRADGSFTFLFCNCVDDIGMRISHVLRGEDHLSNTANQIVLYHALGADVPLFWHLPIICNTEGKKLSKRDFGFSLKDLQQAGYLPEAINNYLAIIGGSYTQEIMSLDELAQTINFESMHTVSAIRYDVDKLTWVNHQWIMRYDVPTFVKLATPFVIEMYPEAEKVGLKKMESLIASVKKEIKTLKEVPHALQFFFQRPVITKEKLLDYIPQELFDSVSIIIKALVALTDKPEQFQETAKRMAKELNIPVKTIFMAIRLLLAGSPTGPSIHDMLTLLGQKEINERLLLMMQ